jgi:ATP-dependent Clp protease ATP-binding subunit ClpC
VLFDEIEKAHPDVFNTLLQILEDGRLTDAQGRQVDFKNTIIIMTSNLGTRDIAKGQSIGFSGGANRLVDYERMKAKVNEELKQHFRPEFLNRIDDIIVFHQLSEEEIIEIVDLMLARVDTQLKNKDMGLELTQPAKALLAAKGYDPVLGARPLRRTIQRDIEDMLSEKILYGELKAGQIVVVDTEPVPDVSAEAELKDRERFTFRGEAKPPSVPDAPPVEVAGSGGPAGEHAD